ncbi:hypothetical protein GCM10023232_27000 [Sphingosinicella ginsenosidimutans]|uniref:hypothetical protein n=1 Tax=Allosphingosinicella ginsenosidimutans TaxID=1176539 RepID=UPI0013154064|nr:hypothetical protein [Sphingosinicella ginsenosidimutans]
MTRKKGRTIAFDVAEYLLSEEDRRDWLALHIEDGDPGGIDRAMDDCDRAERLKMMRD